MTRFGAACVLLVLGAGVARADTGTLPNSATITWDKLFITEGGDTEEPSEPDAQRRYFNLAHCSCSKAQSGTETTFSYEVKLSAETGLSRPADFWVGTTCDNEETRALNCRQLTGSTVSDIDNLFQARRLEFSTFDVINGKADAAACQQREGDAVLWMLVDTDGDTTYDFSSTKKVGTSTEISGIDTQPPPLPVNFSLDGGEESITISWDPPEGRETDLYYYQALCSLDDAAVKPSPPAPEYQTTSSVCGIDQDFDLPVSAIMPGPDDAPVAAAPEAFRRLDRAFLCGSQSGPTATSLTIDGLENGKHYKVALLAMDIAGNVVGTYFSHTATPKPVVDFWEDLNERNGNIDGGCLFATTYGDDSSLTRSLRDFRDHTLADSVLGRALIDAYYATLGRLGPYVEGSRVLRVGAAIALAPLAAIGLVWHALSLPGLLALIAVAWLARRGLRRRRTRIAALATSVIAIGPGLASADDFTPYWEDPAASQVSVVEAEDVDWIAGIRVGPYIPDIDAQVGLNALTGKGPYEAMFGNYWIGEKKYKQAVYQILPMLDVERVLLRGFGQLTVGGQIGYMQKSAYPYLDGSNEDQPKRQRAKGDKTTFRLIPAAAFVGYRLTYLDDAWGIPLVPYVRGGLSYYAWWITKPGGDTSEVGGDDGGDADKARGGSLGYQGSVGLAIRAERIDAASARGMRNSGIQHAGFYGEWSWAKVDGFGSDSKLSVGETTWFAGANFEF